MRKKRPLFQAIENVERNVKHWRRLERLCRELDIEMDGVRCPPSASAILNAMRSIFDDIDDTTATED